MWEFTTMTLALFEPVFVNSCRGRKSDAVFREGILEIVYLFNEGGPGASRVPLASWVANWVRKVYGLRRSCEPEVYCLNELFCRPYQEFCIQLPREVLSDDWFYIAPRKQVQQVSGLPTHRHPRHSFFRCLGDVHIHPFH